MPISQRYAKKGHQVIIEKTAEGFSSCSAPTPPKLYVLIQPSKCCLPFFFSCHFYWAIQHRRVHIWGDDPRILRIHIDCGSHNDLWIRPGVIRTQMFKKKWDGSHAYCDRETVAPGLHAQENPVLKRHNIFFLWSGVVFSNPHCMTGIFLRGMSRHQSRVNPCSGVTGFL